MFEPIWNRNYIDHIQITVAESVDVGHRGGYYDQAGVLRDMFQNHLMQLLALVAMEPPISFTENQIRDEKVKVFSAIEQMTAKKITTDTVRAQYQGYSDLDGVEKDSIIPTYAAIKLNIDTWRWQGVPFYLRSGKSLKTKATEINIQFKKPPTTLFGTDSKQSARSNYISLCIQPHEGIHQQFSAKVPGSENDIQPVDMTFHYDDAFGEGVIPEAYERLLLNAIEGDATLFTRSDGIESAWKTIDNILNTWETEGSPPLDFYLAGSWGPASADKLLNQSKRSWLYNCAEHD
jgi:glucose-6-phosphate 1-dehydrogenase